MLNHGWVYVPLRVILLQPHYRHQQLEIQQDDSVLVATVAAATAATVVPLLVTLQIVEGVVEGKRIEARIQ